MLSRKNIKKIIFKQIISKLLNIKEKEKIFKSSRRKEYSIYREIVIEVMNGFLLSIRNVKICI